MELTPKQARFVAEYLKDLNATQAAVRTGYSVKSAPSQASRLLTNAKVARAVAEGKAKQLESADISATRILEEMKRIALIDTRTFFDADGNVKMRNIPIDSIDSTTGVVTMDPFTYADGEDVDAEDYVTVGRYTTTHSPLVDDFARYLSEYVSRRILFKDSSADAFDVGTEFIDMEQELIDSMKVPDKDLRELEQNDLDPMLYGTDTDIY